MNSTVAILGRLPALGLAELESLFGADAVRPVQDKAAVLNVEPQEFPMRRLGGTMKAGKLLTYLPFADWQQIAAHLVENVPKHLGFIPEGKIKLGISVYGLSVSSAKINATGLQLKKAIKATGRSVRIIPNKAAELNTAQVIYNQLTGSHGLELMIIVDGDRTVLAQTFAVQDIDAYAARDQARPKRDARVGMLPPKLAQLIINLALGQIKRNDEVGMNNEGIVLDPFCGTGVVLQEALLMGYKAYGSDLDARMVDYTRTNLEWLKTDYSQQITDYYVEQGDATSYKWNKFDFVSSETYLGRPFSSEPRPDVLRDVIQDVDTIHRKFLRNLAKQTHPGARLCLAVPAWRFDSPGVAHAHENTKNGFKHLPLLDHLEELGYTRLRFKHVETSQLLYYRPGQHVARELVVLIRK